jgi:predicted dehydrogenase
VQPSRRTFFLGAATAAAASRVFGANDRVRIGLIGAGGRAGDHIRELIRLKDLNVTVGGVCDVWRVNRDRSAEWVAKEFGAQPRTTTDFRELLGFDDIDAVIIATPDFSHPAICKAAVEAKKDVFVEKPFAVEFAGAKSAYLATKASKQVVAAGTQRRSDGNFQAAAKLMQQGAIGKVTRIEMSYNVQAPRWKRADVASVSESDVDWKMFQMGQIDRPFDARLLREWQLFAETTNGIPGLWMSHYIDLVPWFLGDQFPAGAVSNGGVFLWKDGRKTSDVFYTLLDYPKEFLVMFEMSLTNAAGIRNLWYGTKGLLDCEKWTVSGEGSAEKDRVTAEQKIAPETTNSHMANFLECVRSRGTPRADIEAGFAHAVAGIMSAEALKHGRRIRFDREKLELV